MLAPGDLRRCLVAMAGIEQRPLGRALEHRFAGTDVEGHALGNLLLTALGEVTGDFMAALDEVGRLLGLDSTARVLPATVEPVRLRAVTATGAEVVGQVAVSTVGCVERVALEPAGARAPQGLVDAVLRADQVVLGPGSLYTSVLAAAVVDDVRQAIADTDAQRVYVCNLRAEATETRGYDVMRHVEALRSHGVDLDVVLVHAPARGAANGYGTSNHGMTLMPSDVGVDAGVRVVTAELARPHGLAHDSVKLGGALAALISSS